MRVTRHKRQILLFLFAILVPAGVLIGLAGRVVYQDRELVAKRAVDQRRAAVDQLRRELSAHLEAIRSPGPTRGRTGATAENAPNRQRLARGGGRPKRAVQILRPSCCRGCSWQVLLAPE